MKTNRIYRGDAVELMAEFPDESFDLAFCDPPYNLEKAYNAHEDDMDREQYLAWCEEWLAEYVRLLKPEGSLVVVNIPEWALEHAHYLNRHLQFREWISWDAMSVPRGYMMPAHYAVLHYSKATGDLEVNDLPDPQPREWCLRPDCRERQRELTKRNPLTDVWTHIHRIKHEGQRDDHPCQLPLELLESLLALLTDPGDLVIDCMIGTGTTAVAAKRLGREYVGIDVDPSYVALARRKVREATPEAAR